MTIECFAKNNNRKIETVLKWIYEGLIPGSSVDKNYVPESAREPYTDARAKSTEAIYCSIVNASNNRKHVTHKTYGLCENEFISYINRLINAGLIERRVEDGITYYDVTLLALDKKRKFILECIERASRGTAQGITSAVLEAQKAG